jgi:hypothetical protein
VKKKILAMSMAAAICGFTIPAADAMMVADRGRVSIAPLYVGFGDFQTRITVSNPNVDHAVKAKIVFRSACSCEEVLDFVIYLSPGDVWKGTVGQIPVEDLDLPVSSSTRDALDEFDGQIDGTVIGIMTKDDSSKIGGGGIWDNARTDGARVAFNTEKIDPDTGALPSTNPCVARGGDTNQYGHFEVYAAYKLENGEYTGTTTGISNVKVARGMSKSVLASIMDRDNTSGENGGVKKIRSSYQYKNNNIGDSGPGLVVRDSDVGGGQDAGGSPIEIITDVEVVYTPTDARAFYRAPALLGDPITGGVIENPNYSVSIGLDTRLGEYFTGDKVPLTRQDFIDTNDRAALIAARGVTNADDNIGDIEVALATHSTSEIVRELQNLKTTIFMTNRLQGVYRANPDAEVLGENSLHVISFPTRYRHRDMKASAADILNMQPNNVDHSTRTDAGGVFFGCKETANGDEKYTAPFGGDGAMQYSVEVYDMEENAINPPPDPENPVSGGLDVTQITLSLYDEVNFPTKWLEEINRARLEDDPISEFYEGQFIYEFASPLSSANLGAACGDSPLVLDTGNGNWKLIGVPALGMVVHYSNGFEQLGMLSMTALPSGNGARVISIEQSQADRILAIQTATTIAAAQKTSAEAQLKIAEDIFAKQDTTPGAEKLVTSISSDIADLKVAFPQFESDALTVKDAGNEVVANVSRLDFSYNSPDPQEPHPEAAELQKLLEGFDKNNDGVIAVDEVGIEQNIIELHNVVGNVFIQVIKYAELAGNYSDTLQALEDAIDDLAQNANANTAAAVLAFQATVNDMKKIATLGAGNIEQAEMIIEQLATDVSMFFELLDKWEWNATEGKWEAA